MHCKNQEECFAQISGYIDGAATGYPFIINTENFEDYHGLMQRFFADKTKKCVYVSEHTFENGLPDIEAVLEIIGGGGNVVVSGLAQALLLQGETALEEVLDRLISYTVRGHAIVVLCHSGIYLEKYLNRDPRLERRILFFDGEKRPLPRIRLAKTKEECAGRRFCTGIPELLSCLEGIEDAKGRLLPAITVVCPFSKELFQNSKYAIIESEGIYGSLAEKYPELAAAADKSLGTEKQWSWLYKKAAEQGSFAALVAASFGDTDGLSRKLGDTLESGDENAKWMLWLALKVYGSGGDGYLTYALANSDSCESLSHHLHQDLLKIKRTDENFEQFFNERRQLLADIPENLPEIKDYCLNAGVHGRDAVYYLTDATPDEEFAFAETIAKYEWSDEELYAAAAHAFPELALYLAEFAFDRTNTKLSSDDEYLYGVLTDYFRRYKLQKLKNRIEDSFLEKVNAFAAERPFYKLQPRSALVKSLDQTAQAYFFDALGVEYLSYIEAKCEKYGLVYEIGIAHCSLPSITSENKDFAQYFETRDIKALDELKHHSPDYNYEKCEYPIHIFEELKIIERELRRIRAALGRQEAEKAVILSDHGASRLAVIYKHESDSRIELEEKGVHSGRCCQCGEDPGLPQAAYENGYAVLANYERFKGGRRANLEVHGGASLEEVLVPVITLSLRPSDLVYDFTESTLLYKVGKPLTIELFCNAPMKQPRLEINGRIYDGSFAADKKHAKFDLEGLRKQGTYSAKVYDGDKNTGVSLEFEISRNTKEKDLLGIL